DERSDSHDEPGDETATRSVVSPQEEMEAERHEHEDDGGGQGTEKDFPGRHCSSSSRLFVSVCSTGRVRRRSSPKMLRATTASTVISPIVSKPRKSTSMTLTTLSPPARIILNCWE